MGGGRFGAVFRVFVAGAVAAGVLLPLTTRAGAAPAPDPKQAATQAAAMRQQLETRYYALGDRVTTIQMKIDALEARRAELRAVAGQRAAVAYKNQDARVRAIFDACSSPSSRSSEQTA